MVEPLSILVIMAGFATFGDKLIDLLGKLRAERARRNNLAADYFAALGASMSRVVQGLRANQIPRIDGHDFQQLLHAFPEKTRAVRGIDDPKALKASLDEAAQIASTLDGWLLLNVPSLPGEREHMLAIVERIAGTCSAIATTLKDAS